MNQKPVSCGTSLLTSEDVAARLRISKRHIHNLIAEGNFPPPMKVGRLNRWRELDVDCYVERLALAADRTSSGEAV
ncbi:helix-turn-helix domain-containing protein [Roseovarius aestuarii]|nr:helix-turn-helix domain-containing protein [Roseovarius aestuarii]